MGMIKIIPMAVLAMTLGACGEKAAPVEETAQSLSGGLYQLDAEVSTLIATEKLPPATKLKLGDKQQVKACVAADGTPAPELFAEDGDKCTFNTKYIHDGRINAQLNCTRKGMDGKIEPTINGTFKADSFEGQISTGTYLYNDGDYQLV